MNFLKLKPESQQTVKTVAMFVGGYVLFFLAIGVASSAAAAITEQ